MCFLSQVIGQCHCWPSWHLVKPWGNRLNEIYVQFYAYYLHKSKARCHGNSMEVFTVPLSFKNSITVVILNSALGIPWTENNIGHVYSGILNVGAWGREWERECDRNRHWIWGPMRSSKLDLNEKPYLLSLNSELCNLRDFPSSFAPWPCPISSALSVIQIVFAGLIILRSNGTCALSGFIFSCIFIYPCLCPEYMLVLAYFHLHGLWMWNELLGWLLC